MVVIIRHSPPITWQPTASFHRHLQAAFSWRPDTWQFRVGQRMFLPTWQGSGLKYHCNTLDVLGQYNYPFNHPDFHIMCTFIGYTCNIQVLSDYWWYLSKNGDNESDHCGSMVFTFPEGALSGVHYLLVMGCYLHLCRIHILVGRDAAQPSEDEVLSFIVDSAVPISLFACLFRYAVTVWYFDLEERIKAKIQTWTSSTSGGVLLVISPTLNYLNIYLNCADGWKAILV